MWWSRFVSILSLSSAFLFFIFFVIDVYCPQGSAMPVPVAEGFYSIDVEGGNVKSPSTRSDQRICEE
jgi:hypothetical protein